MVFHNFIALLVVLHEQWHGPEAFNDAAELLAAKGYTNSYVHTPSVGNVLKDPFEDSIVTKKVILEELDGKGRDVVVVCHSYGGVVTTNACEGMGRKDREDKETAVIGVVYMCVSACPP
jgi:alpha-beta hydrolase superfamily lysophospholipase